MRKLVALAFLMIATCGSPQVQTPPSEVKLWNNPDEQLRFMIKMSHHLVAPVRDECIDRVLGKLKRGKGQSMAEPEFHQIGLSPGLLSQVKRQAAPAAPAAVASDGCESSLASCGTCHLPRVNNCDYRLTLKDKPTLVGKVIGDGDKIRFAVRTEGEEQRVAEIEPRDILKAEWLNGADDITTWWNFKRLGARSRIVKKMLSLSAKNNVGCTNCHMQHGNFKLNETGKYFDTTGAVKRDVTLEAFLK
ncbi:MAG: hypothetical protein JNJ69_13495 [Leptospiraceae bacterium]|nr:hypothetical protein [Leptospiraceae bacterium]